VYIFKALKEWIHKVVEYVSMPFLSFAHQIDGTTDQLVDEINYHGHHSIVG
jgi:hypothetical protein